MNEKDLVNRIALIQEEYQNSEYARESAADKFRRATKNVLADKNVYGAMEMLSKE